MFYPIQETSFIGTGEGNHRMHLKNESQRRNGSESVGKSDFRRHQTKRNHRFRLGSNNLLLSHQSECRTIFEKTIILSTVDKNL